MLARCCARSEKSMKIHKPTYLIAELTGDIELLVHGLRREFNPERIAWPVDITIAGSSGVGTLQEGQDLSLVVDTFSPIVERLGPPTVRFLAVGQFPGTGVFYLAPEREAFDNLHAAILESGIKFNSNRWPYNPHCTLAVIKEANEFSSQASSMRLPKATDIKCFSLYQPEPNGGTRVHRF